MIFNFDKYFSNKSSSKELNDNDCCRIAAYFTRNGCCYVTGRVLKERDRELHHRIPKSLGGKDTPENLIYLLSAIHKMVHTDSLDDFKKYINELSPSTFEIFKINQLRIEAHKPIFFI